MNDVVAQTAAYEAWVGGRVPLVAADLAAKHAALAGSPLRFLRGTYYLWLAQLMAALPDLTSRTLVPLVGDLHVENFGTWRDAAGTRRWGVNDLDELAWGSYPIDLVRLATSAALVPGLALTNKQICRTLLDHWVAATPRAALDLSTHDAAHLSSMVPAAGAPKAYYAALTGAPAPPVPASVRTAVEQSAPPTWQPQWFARRAGTGSLGRPRVVGVGPDAQHAEHAREVKLLGPLSRDWPGAGNPAGGADDALYPRVQTALHGPDPARRVEGWQLRRLAPDVVRIDLAGLRKGDAQTLLRSMAQAAADVHGADPAALRRAQADCAQRGEQWLHDAVHEMVARTLDAHRTWRAHWNR